MTDDPHDRSIAAWAALTQPEPDCDCPPGWHRQSCDLAYWPPHMREDAEDDE